MKSKFIDAVKQSVKSLFYPQKIDETKISKHAIEIIKVLKKNNYEAYIVGGAIRDILMNKNQGAIGELDITEYNKSLAIFENIVISIAILSIYNL